MYMMFVCVNLDLNWAIFSHERERERESERESEGWMSLNYIWNKELMVCFDLYVEDIFAIIYYFHVKRGISFISL